MTVKTVWFFCGEENILQLDSGGGCITCDYTKNSEMVLFEKVNFLACKLYLNLKNHLLFEMFKCTKVVCG